MASNKTQICNMALAAIRAELISDIDERNSKTASYCKLFYTQARDRVLEDKDWGFASAVSEMSKLAETPKLWTYQYTRPAKCLVPREVITAESDRITITSQEVAPIPWALGYNESQSTQVILTNQDSAWLRFTRTIEDESMFSASFVEALAMSLALRLLRPVGSGKASEAEYLEKLYQKAISGAASLNLNTGQPHPEPDAPWLVARS